MLRSALPLALFAGLAAGQQVASDDFNRPNSTNMGPDWAEMNGDTIIQSNRGRGNSGFDIGWMSHTSFVAPYAGTVQSIDIILTTPGGDSVSLVSGLDTATWGGISVKLQDNDGDGKLDRLFFESAINAGSWNGGPPVHFDLATPTARARMTLSFTDAGDTAVCEILNFATGATEVYQAGGILSSPFPPVGLSVAIAHRGDGFFDNWTASSPVALAGAPGFVSVSAGGFQALEIHAGQSHAGRLYLVLGTNSGTSPGFDLGAVHVPLVVDAYTIFTVEMVNSGLLQGTFGTLDAAGKGSAAISIPPGSDPTLAGLGFHHAALVLDPLDSAVVVDASNAVGIGLIP